MSSHNTYHCYFNTHIISVALWCLTYATYNIYTITLSSCTIIFVPLTNYPYTHIWSYHIYSYIGHYSQHHCFHYSMSLSYYYACYSYYYILLLVVSSTLHSCQVPPWINIHQHLSMTCIHTSFFFPVITSYCIVISTGSMEHADCICVISLLPHTFRVIANLLFLHHIFLVFIY